ncbi:MAG: hypothetical protein P1V51_07125 [Deltaproteobacteria bacterium]|nr:hypothetical protein [Deltaproteobacteria bacterium]
MGDARRLAEVAHQRGGRLAAEKVRLLEDLRERGALGRRERRGVAASVNYLRAYPDDAAVRRAAERLAAELPAEEVVYEYSYGVLQRLVRLFPGALEFDWELLPDDGPIIEALEVLLPPGERQAFESGDLGVEEWFSLARPEPGCTDLEHLLRLFERSSLPGQARVLLFERCELPVRYAGPPSTRIAFPTGRVSYRRRPPDRSRFPLPPVIRSPLGRLRRGGPREIDLALQALCARSLEIHSLIYPNPEEVWIADCGRGLEVLLIGTHPDWRGPWEVISFFGIVQNGVPLAYGPAGVFGGCCEMGINLFPEFRGAEIRNIYAQLMRVLHHHLGVEYFFLDRYGMGVGNPDAIASGAFWFYRKLGFLPTEPVIAELALREEERMRREPGYRCDRRTLRRLSHTEAYLDLSGGRLRPLDLAGLGAAESAQVARRFAGDRERARRASVRSVAKVLELDPREPALPGLAPTLALLPDLEGWPRAERRRLARFVRAKGAAQEAEAARLSARLPRLLAGLRALARPEGGGSL